jgi:hypothetical protein
MTCKELQNLLTTVRIDELEMAERNLLEQHLTRCEACAKVFQQVAVSDRVLTTLKISTPRIRNEEALTESILTAIEGGRRPSPGAETVSFLDRLDALFRKEVIRFACSLLLLFCGMAYILMEYNDTKAIVSLEERLGNQTRTNQASLIYQGINVLNFLQDLYNLSNGRLSSVELTNTLVLIRKADLQTLLQEYKTLDKASKARLDAMWDQYLKEESFLPGSEKNREEIAALRNEIKRLKMELERNNTLKGRP